MLVRYLTIIGLAQCSMACSFEEPHAGGAADEAACAASTLTEAQVFGGTNEPTSLMLGAEQERAIVAISIDGGQSICTGVLVGSELVLTAAHCVAAARRLNVVIGSSLQAANAEIEVARSHLHPRLDVAALEVKVPSCAGVEPLSLLPNGLDQSWVDAPVELSGFGLTADSSTLGERFFASERIIALEEDHVVVASPAASSGACQGDSGGPLLSRTPDGVAVVLGTLDDGSASCLGSDYFVRSDRISAWLPELGAGWSAE